MTNSIKPRKITFLIHILIWIFIAIVIFVVSPLSWKVDLPIEYWFKQGLTLLFLILGFYLNMYVLVPKLLFKDRIWAFIGLGILLILLFLFLIIQFENLVNLPELMHNAFRPDKPYLPKPRNFSYDLFTILLLLFGLGISTSVVVVEKWQTDAGLRRQMEKEKVSSELSYLKAQINPHFFFNTLNNIYSLTNIDVERAQKAILKLSRMMRYVLYETDKDTTYLSKELDFIKDYVDLMQLRLTDKVKLILNIQETGEDITIAPMLLLPFIENCFKHGVSSKTESKIEIYIGQKGKVLELKTVNLKFPPNPKSKENMGSGIGLTNTRRRLDLIYGEKCKLLIDEENPENEYRVQLNLNLG
ncbi:sensor histidine kinase [Cyclobacterium marinum]|uniref:Putative signal transduction histidine kinase n=1 Tax=Cyclobacterium marinum (strain ATCC 25205 / DSM 745 / LMG 13164 / NCIMB 1802) TaxID=880070 RepID=G0J2V4_CYCMS|nr:histidine kinase [Cyclobacterium marinum]AEL27441.1 putative signal transduction histidine kinase [Cyclobacterium marinum DSM 745]MBI0397217.1 histidine kinase [Cyclobacterium marinum]